MSFFVTSWRIIVAAWKHFTRNVWLALTTVFVLTLALLSVNILIAVNVLFSQAIHTLEDKIDVSVYFVPGTAQSVVDEAKFFMSSQSQVQAATVVTADEALANFKKLHANDPKILSALDEVGANPLGATLIIKARDSSQYPFLLQVLKNPQFDFAIQSKNYEDHADTIARVEQLAASIRVFGFILITVFAIFSILIVFNTIRIAIYTQREEIGVMRLVGASSAYVRWPFVIEGILLAGFALLVTAGLVALVTSAVEPHLRTLFDGADPGLVSYFVTNATELLLIEGTTLAVLVGLSSWAAVGKYLKR